MLFGLKSACKAQERIHNTPFKAHPSPTPPLKTYPMRMAPFVGLAALALASTASAAEVAMLSHYTSSGCADGDFLYRDYHLMLDRCEFESDADGGFQRATTNQTHLVTTKWNDSSTCTTEGEVVGETLLSCSESSDGDFVKVDIIEHDVFDTITYYQDAQCNTAIRGISLWPMGICWAENATHSYREVITANRKSYDVLYYRGLRCAGEVAGVDAPGHEDWCKMTYGDGGCRYDTCMQDADIPGGQMWHAPYHDGEASGAVSHSSGIMSLMMVGGLLHSLPRVVR